MGSLSAGHKSRGLPIHAAIAATFLLLFVFRVLAQLLQFFRPISALPPFEAWESGAIPYWLLVVAQVAIALVSGALIVSLFRRRLRPNRTVGIVLMTLGGLYLAGSLFRLVAGYTFLAETAFFDDHLPAYFHVVLACLLFTFGDFYRYGY
ncbi:MAG: hypothetical protein KDK07_03405 [Bauldia sp.]|nr:hypothetical protein [Bauldia sp.]